MPDPDRLQFAVLGPLEVTAGGVPVVLGGTQRKVLLAALLLEAGQVLSTQRLIEVIWSEPAPERALATLRTHVSELRRRLESPSSAQVLIRRGAGYLLDVGPAQIDAERARRLLEQGRRAIEDGDPVSAIAPLQEAQALWRGQPLVDLVDYPFTTGYVEKLTELHLDIQKTRISADLSLGRHREVIGDLRMLVTRHPHDDGLRRELVLAFYRDGRTEDAARACREGLEALHDLGLESPLLQRLQEDVLRADPGLAWTPPRALGRPVSAPPTGQGVYQLPPDIEEFTGRDTIRGQILATLTDPVAGAKGTVVAAIAGKAGAGKTALAVYVAHRVRAQFADALYVDLRGTSEPLDPHRVLGRFVQAMGVSRAAVPSDPDHLVEVYRSLLVNRRVLILLDNAANEAQIRPLLPTSPGSVVIVTSRSRMHGLTPSYWMVDVLHPGDAVELLSKVVDERRVSAEPEAARDIVGLCGYLPLAIQIAGRKLAAHPHWRLTRLASRLANERDRLSWLEAGDLEVRASFGLSYEGRPADEQRAFRLLALPELADFAPWAAAAVLDVGLDEAEDVVDRLVDAQLLERRGVDRAGTERYRFHDLLRVFAREKNEASASAAHPTVPPGPGFTRTATTGVPRAAPTGTDTGAAPAAQVPRLAPEHAQALDRLLYAYLAVLRGAVDEFAPGTARTIEPAAHTPAAGGSGGPGHAVDPEVHAVDPDVVAALTAQPLLWFGGERVNLLALVDQAHRHGLDEPTWLLAIEAAEFCAFGAHWSDWERIHTLALAAARRRGNRLAEAVLLCGLGERDITLAFEHAFWRLDAPGADNDGEPAAVLGARAADHLDLATERLERARSIFVEYGDTLGEARTLHGLADAARGRGDAEGAVEHFEQCLALTRRGGARRAEAEALICLAMAHGDRDELGEGITCLSISLSIARELTSRSLEALALRRLGDLHRHRPERALAHYNESLPLLSALPDILWEPRILVRRGDILARLDDHLAARRSWQQAVTLLRQHGSTELAAAESRLARPASTAPTQFASGRLLGDFDPAYFIGRVATSRRSVRLLNTWTDLLAPAHVEAFAEALLTAVDAGAMVQILLLDPDSPPAAGRAEDLLHSIDVPNVIRANLRVLDTVRARLVPALRPRLSVRIYGDQPLTTYHRWDSGALISTFPFGHSSAATTQHEAAISSTLVQFVEQHFEKIWHPDRSVSLDDYLRVPLRILRTDGPGRDARTIQARYARLGDTVYLADEELTRLVHDGGADGLVTEIGGTGRHPLTELHRCRVVPAWEGRDGAADAFAKKYGPQTTAPAPDGPPLRLAPMRPPPPAPTPPTAGPPAAGPTAPGPAGPGPRGPLPSPRSVP
ncbi:NB-ARC domain-containing protein [Frankia sp. Mgl5]|uniref:BTAD domain-containing putative transcriptional regulator n=1 Tax=Frankia sp. Mgl5 TaxID=2933793 RepID=UPI00200C9834|nr:BTAD domain-containing putative transcriptional regulator [Frankia sp. Mgl5]MCK9928536.1 NB-ARC domain-containing protein [Frankia sp. Mgl5]